IDQLLKTKRVVKLPKGTKVLIVANSRPEKSPRPPRIYHGIQEFHEALQMAALAPKEDFSKLPVEVRILDGGFAGQKRYIPEEYLAHLVPKMSGGAVVVSVRLPADPIPFGFRIAYPDFGSKQLDSNASASNAMNRARRAERNAGALEIETED